MRALVFNFKEWMKESDAWEAVLESVINKDGSGHPLELKLEFPNGETEPPICVNNHIKFEGRGFICFDFDQTLTTAWYGHPNHPSDTHGHSTASPNPIMLKKMQEHKRANNLIAIVTARGENEGQLTGDKSHFKGLQPILTRDKSQDFGGSGPKPDMKRDWHPGLKGSGWSAISQSMTPDMVYHLGAISLHTKTENKGPFIASRMAWFHQQSVKKGGNDYTWGILYDDGHSNVESANAQQKRGVALAGIAVAPNWEKGGEPPAGAVIGRSSSGM